MGDELPVEIFEGMDLIGNLAFQKAALGTVAAVGLGTASYFLFADREIYDNPQTPFGDDNVSFCTSFLVCTSTLLTLTDFVYYD